MKNLLRELIRFTELCLLLLFSFERSRSPIELDAVLQGIMQEALLPQGGWSRKKLIHLLELHTSN